VAFKFNVSGRISRPVGEVFEAVADPAKLSGYFTTGGAKGRLETGATVTWEFADFPGAFPVEVAEVVENERIVLHWDAEDGAKTKVTMTFTALEGGRTLVNITEEGFTDTPEGQQSAFGNCMGWAQMICALRAWVEHGINLREGFYV